MGRPVQAASTETFGLPDTATHLINKLRNIHPDLLAQLLKKADH